MMANETVNDRLEHVQTTLTPTQLAIGLGLILAISFGLTFLQEPMVHDALHHFRHGAGITCM